MNGRNAKQRPGCCLHGAAAVLATVHSNKDDVPSTSLLPSPPADGVNPVANSLWVANSNKNTCVAMSCVLHFTITLKPCRNGASFKWLRLPRKNGRNVAPNEDLVVVCVVLLPEKPPLHVFFDMEAMQDTGCHVPNLVMAETENDEHPVRFQEDSCMRDHFSSSSSRGVSPSSRYSSLWLASNPFPTSPSPLLATRKSNANHYCIALEWVHWQQHLLPDEDDYIRHVGNSGEYQIPHSRYTVDGCHEKTNTVYEFQGHFWHGCPVCYSNRTESHCCLDNRCFDDVYRCTQVKLDLLRNRGFRVVEIWECQWENMRKYPNSFWSVLPSVLTQIWNAYDLRTQSVAFPDHSQRALKVGLYLKKAHFLYSM